MKYVFCDDGDYVSWQYIRELYFLEQDSGLKAALKLTLRHIFITPWSKMSVRLAAQVFSHSVAAALRTAIEVGDISADARKTADFIGHMNRLFDNLNSRIANDRNPYRCALSDKNPQVEKSLRDSLCWLETLQVCNPKEKNIPCIDGMIISIKSTLSLWKDLKEEGTLFLLTSRLNQDPLENLFAILRQRSGNNNNPTAQQFRYSLQSVINIKLLVPPATANCERDSDCSLLSREEIADKAADDLIEGKKPQCFDPAPVPEEPLAELEQNSIDKVPEAEDSETEPSDNEDDEPIPPPTKKCKAKAKNKKKSSPSGPSQPAPQPLAPPRATRSQALAPKVCLEDCATGYVGGYLA